MNCPTCNSIMVLVDDYTTIYRCNNCSEYVSGVE